jgi:hypothetical protein
MSRIEKEMSDVSKLLATELQRTVKKVEGKINQHYKSCLEESLTTFYL